MNFDEIDETKLPKGVQIDDKELSKWHDMVNQKPFMPDTQLASPSNQLTDAYKISSNLRTSFLLAPSNDIQRQFYRPGARLFRFMPQQ